MNNLDLVNLTAVIKYNVDVYLVMKLHYMITPFFLPANGTVILITDVNILYDRNSFNINPDLYGLHM